MGLQIFVKITFLPPLLVPPPPAGAADQEAEVRCKTKFQPKYAPVFDAQNRNPCGKYM